uniref:Uncharacterized protein n=1 Tax=Anguilla anguilla TaxID=7936 RepID=A0A0E9QA19_ANGAN
MESFPFLDIGSGGSTLVRSQACQRSEKQQVLKIISIIMLAV